MNAIYELFRTLVAIFIEEGWYVLAALVVIAVITTVVYRHSIKGWLRNLRRLRDTSPKEEATSTRAAASPQDDASQTTQSPPPSHSEAESDEVPVPEEVRLQRTMACFENQSTQPPMVAFKTTRLKQEVLKLLLDYLSDLKDPKKTPVKFSFKYAFMMQGVTGDGKSWTCIGLERALDDLPHDLLSLEIDGRLIIEVATTKRKENDIVKIRGWFVGDRGHWTVYGMESWFEKNEKYEVPMYDWYQLKQRISKIVADFLDLFTDQGA